MKIDWLFGMTVDLEGNVTYHTKEDMMSEKFVSPCPPPTPHERELLEILIEECAEVQQRATKMLRFGVQEVQPSQPLTNAQRLAREYGDVIEVSERLMQIGLVPEEDVIIGRANKRRQLAKYMQTTPEKKA